MVFFFSFYFGKKVCVRRDVPVVITVVSSRVFYDDNTAVAVVCYSLVTRTLAPVTPNLN